MQQTDISVSPVHTLIDIFWKNTHTPPGLVQAPNRFTTFRWCPMWLRILSSVIRALCSLAVAPSGGHRAEKKKKVTFCAEFNFIFSESSDLILYLWASWQPQCCSWWCCLYRTQMPASLYQTLHGPEVSLKQRERKNVGETDRVKKNKGVFFVSNWATLLITIIIHCGRETLIRED